MAYCIICMDNSGGLTLCPSCNRAWEAHAVRGGTTYAAVRWAARRARRLARRRTLPARIPSPEAIEAAKDALREAIPYLPDKARESLADRCRWALAKLEGRS